MTITITTMIILAIIITITIIIFISIIITIIFIIIRNAHIRAQPQCLGSSLKPSSILEQPPSGVLNGTHDSGSTNNNRNTNSNEIEIVINVVIVIILRCSYTIILWRIVQNAPVQEQSGKESGKLQCLPLTAWGRGV